MGGDWPGAQAGHQPGQRALPALPCHGALQDSAHTTSAPGGVPARLASLGTPPKGLAPLSQHSPTKSTAFSVPCKVTGAQPLLHGSCATGDVCLGICCGRTQRRHSHTRTPSLETGSWGGPLGSGEASADLKGGCWVQGVPGNMHHAAWAQWRPLPTAGRPLSKATVLTTCLHMPVPLCFPDPLRSWRHGAGPGPTA